MNLVKVEILKTGITLRLNNISKLTNNIMSLFRNIDNLEKYPMFQAKTIPIKAKRIISMCLSILIKSNQEKKLAITLSPLKIHTKISKLRQRQESLN
jgi:hypothetical protein